MFVQYCDIDLEYLERMIRSKYSLFTIVGFRL